MVSDAQQAHRSRLADYWRSPEGKARRSELSKRPEHLAKLKLARDARTADQIEQAAVALRKWNASPEGAIQSLRNLEKIHKDWNLSPENRENLDRIHDTWARSPEGIAHSSANRPGLSGLAPELRARDGDACQLCLKKIDFRLRKRHPMSRSVDHIVPIRAGGSDDLGNLWLSHLLCNMKKGARHVGRKDGTTDVRAN